MCGRRCRGVAPGERVFMGALGTPGCSTIHAVVAVVGAAAVHSLPSTLSNGQGGAVGIPCVNAWRRCLRRLGFRGRAGVVGEHVDWSLAASRVQMLPFSTKYGWIVRLWSR